MADSEESFLDRLMVTAASFGTVQSPFGEGLPRAAAGNFIRNVCGRGSAASLAKAAISGSGPLFHRTPAGAIYPVRQLCEWTLSRFSEARASHVSKTEAA